MAVLANRAAPASFAAALKIFVEGAPMTITMRGSSSTAAGASVVVGSDIAAASPEVAPQKETLNERLCFVIQTRTPYYKQVPRSTD